MSFTSLLTKAKTLCTTHMEMRSMWHMAEIWYTKVVTYFQEARNSPSSPCCWVSIHNFFLCDLSWCGFCSFGVFVCIFFLNQPARGVLPSFTWRSYKIVWQKQRRLQLPEIMAIRKHAEQKLTKIRPQEWFSPLRPQLLHWHPWKRISQCPGEGWVEGNTTLKQVPDLQAQCSRQKATLLCARGNKLPGEGRREASRKGALGLLCSNWWLPWPVSGWKKLFCKRSMFSSTTDLKFLWTPLSCSAPHLFSGSTEVPCISHTTSPGSMVTVLQEMTSCLPTDWFNTPLVLMPENCSIWPKSSVVLLSMA